MKRLGHGVDHSPSASAVVRTQSSCTSPYLLYLHGIVLTKIYSIIFRKKSRIQLSSAVLSAAVHVSPAVLSITTVHVQPAALSVTIHVSPAILHVTTVHLLPAAV